MKTTSHLGAIYIYLDRIYARIGQRTRNLSQINQSAVDSTCNNVQKKVTLWDNVYINIQTLYTPVVPSLRTKTNLSWKQSQLPDSQDVVRLLAKPYCRRWISKGASRCVNWDILSYDNIPFWNGLYLSVDKGT